MKKRNEIEEKYKWDLTEYFKDIDAWENSLENLKKLNIKLESYKGKLNDDQELLDMLILNKQIDELTSLLYVYIELKNKEDAKNATYKNLENKLMKYLADVAPKLSFITNELNEIDDQRIDRLASDSRFADFDLELLDIKRNRPHILSAVEEKLLAKMSEAVGGQGEVFDMLDSADITFEDVTDSVGNKFPLNNANYSVYTKSSDRKLRETANQNINGAYGKLNYTLSTNYLNHIKVDSTSAKVRNFNSAFESALFAEEVDGSIYESLVKNVKENLDVFHKFFNLKKKSLNLNDFYNYDISAGLGALGDTKYTYDQAYGEVTDALKCLGDDYINVLNRAKQERWIDVMPNENKDTGAFSWGAYGAHPVVLLNFEGTSDSVSTLAHELGHMMHTYYSNKNNPSTKAGYEIFVAEVASTVNELLLLEYNIKNANSKDEMLFYFDQTMQRCYGTILRQTMFAEFEKLAHDAYENGGDTTTEGLNAMYFNLLKEYFGKDVNLADNLEFEYTRIPHLYTSFYVYKYATGIISAMAIVTNILAGNTCYVQKYKEFLSSGCNRPPVELLKIAEVDLNDQKTFDSAFLYMKNILNRWENCLK